MGKQIKDVTGDKQVFHANRGVASTSIVSYQLQAAFPRRDPEWPGPGFVR
jgi:hypothetical protein